MHKKIFQVIVVLNFINCMAVQDFDDYDENLIRQEMRKKRVEQEVSRRLAHEAATKNNAQKPDNQFSLEDLISPDDVKISFDLVQKNIFSDDKNVQYMASDLFLKLQSILSQQQKKQLISHLLQELVHQSDLEKTDYNKIASSFRFLFDLVKKDILNSSVDLNTLFKQFKTLLFRELEENKNDEQERKLQAKVNVQVAGQYQNIQNLQLLSILESLIRLPQHGMISSGLNLENKQIFQSLFDIVQTVAQEADPKIKSRGLFMLGQMIQN